MVVHKIMIHGMCPINRNWDYYELTVRTDGFIRCEDIEKHANVLRGAAKTQEDMANDLRELFPAHCILELRGRHGSNCETLVEV